MLTYSALSVLSLQRVLVILDVEAAPLPLMSPLSLVPFGGEYERLHANGIGGVVLLQVHNVKPVRIALGYVSDREEEPLAVGQGVVVKVQVQVVLTFLDSFGFSQVARFKLGIEEQCLVIHVPDEEWFWGRILLVMLEALQTSPILYGLLDELVDV